MHEVLRALRIKKGLHQDDIGEALGITKASVSRIERGETVMSIVQAQLWAERCGARVVIISPEHDALLAEVVKVPPTRLSIALRIIRALPGLHTLRFNDLHGLLSSWEQVSGSDVNEDVKNMSTHK